MRSRFPRNSGRFILALMIFGAVLGVRLAPWPADEPVADRPPGFVVSVPQLRFRDPAALEAAVPEAKAPRTFARRTYRTSHLAPRTFRTSAPSTRISQSP